MQTLTWPQTHSSKACKEIGFSSKHVGTRSQAQEASANKQDTQAKMSLLGCSLSLSLSFYIHDLSALAMCTHSSQARAILMHSRPLSMPFKGRALGKIKALDNALACLPKAGHCPQKLGKIKALDNSMPSKGRAQARSKPKALST